MLSQKRANQEIDETSRKKVSTSTTTPTLPLEVWDIIIEYAVADLTKKVRSGCSQVFTRTEKGKLLPEDKKDSPYLQRLYELCTVNKAFNASVKSMDAYTQIWDRLKVLDPIRRVTQLYYTICNCNGPRCGGAVCKGEWEVYFDANVGDKKKMNRAVVKFLRLLTLPEPLHVDVVTFFASCNYEYFLPALAKILPQFISRYPGCLSYTKRLHLSTEEDYELETCFEDEDEDRFEEIMDKITENLGSISPDGFSNRCICDECKSEDIFINSCSPGRWRYWCESCRSDFDPYYRAEHGYYGTDTSSDG